MSKVELISLNKDTGSFLLKVNKSDSTLFSDITKYIYDDSPIAGDQHNVIEINEYIAVETDSISSAKRLSDEILEKFNKE